MDIITASCCFVVPCFSHGLGGIPLQHEFAVQSGRSLVLDPASHNRTENIGSAGFNFKLLELTIVVVQMFTGLRKQLGEYDTPAPFAMPTAASVMAQFHQVR